MIDQIKELYAQIDHKTQFIANLAEKLGKSPQSLRVHWFAQFWSIPEEYQPKVVKFLKYTIKEQKHPA